MTAELQKHSPATNWTFIHHLLMTHIQQVQKDITK